jgi:hypothetical protein
MFVNSENPNHPRFQPGMPTRGSQAIELLLGFFPGWIALIGITLALLMPHIQSCRNADSVRAGQAPPLNAEVK